MNTGTGLSKPFTGEPDKADYNKNLNALKPQAEQKNDYLTRDQSNRALGTQNNTLQTDQNGYGNTMETNADAKNKQDSKDDLKSAALKLKAQNEKLKAQLKELGTRLAQTLMKIQEKKEQKKLDSVKQEDPLMKELDASNKYLTQVKKELQALKSKLSTSQSELRIQTLENNIKAKEKQIEQLTIENAALEKTRRDQERDLEMYHSVVDYQGQLKNFEDESKKLRAKIRELYEQSRNDDRIYKMQQEKLVLLERKYREACEKLGISASLNLTKAEERDRGRSQVSPKVIAKKKEKENNLIKNERYFGYPVEDGDEDDAKLEFTQENFQRLMNECNNLNDIFQAAQKKYRTEMDNLNGAADSLDKDKKTLEDKIREKEKEANMLNHRMSEFKRVTKLNGLNINVKSSFDNNAKTPM